MKKKNLFLVGLLSSMIFSICVVLYMLSPESTIPMGIQVLLYVGSLVFLMLWTIYGFRPKTEKQIGDKKTFIAKILGLSLLSVCIISIMQFDLYLGIILYICLIFLLLLGIKDILRNKEKEAQKNGIEGE